MLAYNYGEGAQAPRRIGSHSLGHSPLWTSCALNSRDATDLCSPRPEDRRPFRCQRGDQGRVRAEEEIADCRAPAVSDPALRQMVRPIVQHVAALTERAQVL